MNKKKVFKIVLSIALFIVFLVIVNTVRNLIIISDLQNKIQDKIDSTNVHSKISFTYQNVIVEQYRRDNDFKYIIKGEANNEMITYKIGNKVTTFIDNGYKKTVDERIDIDDELEYGTMMDFVNTDTVFEKIKNCVVSLIKTENVDGKDAYVIINSIIRKFLIIQSTNKSVHLFLFYN